MYKKRGCDTVSESRAQGKFNSRHSEQFSFKSQNTAAEYNAGQSLWRLTTEMHCRWTLMLNILEGLGFILKEPLVSLILICFVLTKQILPVCIVLFGQTDSSAFLFTIVSYIMFLYCLCLRI